MDSIHAFLEPTAVQIAVESALEHRDLLNLAKSRTYRELSKRERLKVLETWARSNIGMTWDRLAIDGDDTVVFLNTLYASLEDLVVEKQFESPASMKDIAQREF